MEEIFVVIVLWLQFLHSCTGRTGQLDAERMEFSQESCQVETVTSMDYNNFYPLNNSRNSVNRHLIELKVRFKGYADGHIALTSTPDVSRPHYVMIAGSYNNQKCEIRKSSGGRNWTTEIPVQTPGILSQHQFRGFIVRYARISGTLSMTPEGSDMPLLLWRDPSPLDVNYFAFSAYRNRVVKWRSIAIQMLEEVPEIRLPLLPVSDVCRRMQKMPSLSLNALYQCMRWWLS